MVNFKINGKDLTAKRGTTILEAAQQAGIPIPHLCYLKDLNEIGACRMCMVEIEGTERLVPACNTELLEGMVIHTNSAKVRQARRTNLCLILSQHNSNCTVCVRSGNCALQTLAHDLNIHFQPYEVQLERSHVDLSNPVVREASKCIKCMRCVQICDKVQGMHIWDVVGTGSRTTVGLSGVRSLKDTDCTFCGQCVTHCPTGALTVRDDTNRVLKALGDPDIVTVVQVAPAVRAAWAESFDIPAKLATTGRMVAALKSVGFDYVFDTNFAADLTIMEEGSEFVERFTHRGKHRWPMFTSCCPGWVRFLKLEYPELVSHLSTAKSPQQMFGAVTKSYFAEQIGVDPADICCVSIMPCTAKKYESDVPEVSDAAHKDVDIVLTTRELDRMLRALHVNAKALPEEEFDSPLGEGTGAAVIFGVTGGVMEAALRSAHYLLTGQNPDPDAFREVRGSQGWREASFDINGTTLRLAVANGLGNARDLIKAIKSGRAQYDFVEVMACPGGCAGGGGQPIRDGEDLSGERGAHLYDLDAANPVRFSHENTQVQRLYRDYLEEPLGHKSHHLLHTDQSKWSL